MIEIQNKINKKQVLEGMEAYAKFKFKDCWESEYCVRHYMFGVHDLIAFLQGKSTEELKKFANLNEEGRRYKK